MSCSYMGKYVYEMVFFFFLFFLLQIVIDVLLVIFSEVLYVLAHLPELFYYQNVWVLSRLVNGIPTVYGWLYFCY